MAIAFYELAKSFYWWPLLPVGSPISAAFSRSSCRFLGKLNECSTRPFDSF